MYDPEKDEILKAEEVQVKDGMWIEVAVAAYDGGEPKIQITRQIENAGGVRRHIKLGRLTFEEMELVVSVYRQLKDATQ